jgi:hypothetical protein
LLAVGKAHITAGARARQAFCHLLGRLDEVGLKLMTTMYTGKMQVLLFLFKFMSLF